MIFGEKNPTHSITGIKGGYEETAKSLAHDWKFVRKFPVNTFCYLKKKFICLKLIINERERERIFSAHRLTPQVTSTAIAGPY